MKKIISIIFLSFLISFNSCGSKSGGLTEPIPSGTYSYTSYDTTGTAIVRGWLTINYKDSSEITGEWHFGKIGNPNNTGPQIGSGELSGRIADDRIWLELHPQFVDNNLQLSGKVENDMYSGVWQWITLKGITNFGTFEAVRN